MLALYAKGKLLANAWIRFKVAIPAVAICMIQAISAVNIYRVNCLKPFTEKLDTAHACMAN